MATLYLKPEDFGINQPVSFEEMDEMTRRGIVWNCVFRPSPTMGDTTSLGELQLAECGVMLHGVYVAYTTPPTTTNPKPPPQTQLGRDFHLYPFRKVGE